MVLFYDYCVTGLYQPSHNMIKHIVLYNYTDNNYAGCKPLIPLLWISTIKK